LLINNSQFLSETPYKKIRGIGAILLIRVPRSLGVLIYNS
jgi:hypothetical protein